MQVDEEKDRLLHYLPSQTSGIMPTEHRYGHADSIILTKRTESYTFELKCIINQTWKISSMSSHIISNINPKILGPIDRPILLNT